MARQQSLTVDTRLVDANDFSFNEGSIWNKTYQTHIDAKNFDLPATWMQKYPDADSTRMMFHEALERKAEDSRIIFNDKQLLFVERERTIIQPELLFDWVSDAVKKTYHLVPTVKTSISGCTFTFECNIGKEFRITPAEGDILESSVLFQYTPMKELRSGWSINRLICTNGQTRIEEKHRWSSGHTQQAIKTQIEEEVGAAYVRSLQEGSTPAVMMSMRPIPNVPHADFIRRIGERFGFTEHEILIAIQNFNRYGEVNLSAITEWDVYNALSYSASRALDANRRALLQRICGNILAQSSSNDLVSARVPAFIAAAYGE